MKRVLALLVIGALGGSAMAADAPAAKPAKAHHVKAKAKKTAKKARKAKTKAKHHAKAKAGKAAPAAAAAPTK